MTQSWVELLALEDRRILKELNKCWALSNKMQYSSEKCNVLHNQMHRYSIGGTWLNSSNRGI